MCIAPFFAGHGRRVIGAGALTLAFAMLPALAKADCGTDMNGLMSKRMANIAALNQNTRAHGGKLDPVTACPQLRALAAAEANVLAYMTKNKEWCSIPDDLVSKMTDSRTKTAGVAVKACDFAVKIKKMQTQQAQQAQAGAAAQAAVKLPAGPL